jgi:hypothetical protein
MVMKKRTLLIAVPTLLLAAVSFAQAGPAISEDAGTGGAASASGPQPGVSGGNPLSGEATGQAPSFGGENSPAAGLSATPAESMPDSDATSVLSTDGSGDKK